MLKIRFNSLVLLRTLILSKVLIFIESYHFNLLIVRWILVGFEQFLRLLLNNLLAKNVACYLHPAHNRFDTPDLHRAHLYPFPQNTLLTTVLIPYLIQRFHFVLLVLLKFVFQHLLIFIHPVAIVDPLLYIKLLLKFECLNHYLEHKDT